MFVVIQKNANILFPIAFHSRFCSSRFWQTECRMMNFVAFVHRQWEKTRLDCGETMEVLAMKMTEVGWKSIVDWQHICRVPSYPTRCYTFVVLSFLIARCLPYHKWIWQQWVLTMKENPTIDREPHPSI